MSAKKSKKILFAGASGYGNLGDDSYVILFKKYFEQMGYEVQFDSPFPDLGKVEWADHIVIGGGGLVYVNKTAHVSYMTSYLDAAEKLGKSYSFLSCGVQIYGVSDNMPADVMVAKGKEQLGPWKKYLKNAKIVTVRSERCKEIIDHVTNNESNCHFVPDLAYAFLPPERATQKGRGVIIPTKLSTKNPEFAWTWAHLQNVCDEIIVLAMSKDDYDVANLLHSYLKKNPNVKDSLQWDINPREALKIIGTAETVVAARYHGNIFARVAGIDENNLYNIDRRYKSIVEVPPEDLSDALKVFKLFSELDI